MTRQSEIPRTFTNLLEIEQGFKSVISIFFKLKISYYIKHEDLKKYMGCFIDCTSLGAENGGSSARKLKVPALNTPDGSKFHRRRTTGRNDRLNWSFLQLGITKANSPGAAAALALRAARR